MTAAWVPCPCCEDYLCLIHNQHVYNCPCPPIEEWKENPYGDEPTASLA
jgi:hypothetical protein